MGKKAEKKTVRKTTRFTKRESYKLQWLADTYAGGDVAKWMRHGALNAERKYLK